jgi:hypothetical protein
MAATAAAGYASISQWPECAITTEVTSVVTKRSYFIGEKPVGIRIRLFIVCTSGSIFSV